MKRHRKKPPKPEVCQKKEFVKKVAQIHFCPQVGLQFAKNTHSSDVIRKVTVGLSSP